MREPEVQAKFVAYLIERGWDVSTQNADHADLIARRGAERLVAEVKGHTSSPGLDVDTAYGQLLRRMTDDNCDSEFALVVPESLEGSVVRVPGRVRRQLGVEVWLVPDSGEPRRIP